MKWKILDVLALLLSVSLFLGSLWWTFQKEDGDSYLYIKTSQGQWYYPLDEDKDLDFEGPLGISHLHISDGSVSFSDSPCDNKTCINRGGIDRINQWNACLPNQVFISIDGKESEGALDDQAY